ncbi:hypothetical protein SAMD00023353_3400070 [Rosellinia necatrix]|uniref:Myb-like DNA-binding domain-containing protein n=1 Tax=Rosellinia necatrix TaxID=77044 RepID=A0A1W2TKY2_ROSNE|nr:hypothetical protein SAMD00023353_3400070 [Rosellinia necatrix]
MPSGPDTDSQFRFLISCIRNSTAGKVDFEEVRKECDIISKGAAAKRYERLMKAHNIAIGAAAGGVKKEAKDSEDVKKPKSQISKKRKLKEVEDDEDDVDEPVKKEVKIKGEVKNEDANVKPEYPSDAMPNATPMHRPSAQSHPASSSADAQSNDEDEVLFISAINKRSAATEAPAYADNQSRPNMNPSALFAPGIQSIDYAANTSFPQQPSTTEPSNPVTTLMATTRPVNPFPYGLAPTAWAFPHDSHSYL